MKKFIILYICIFIIQSLLTSQSSSFSFDNAEITLEDGKKYFEIDVMISSDTDFKLGSGQLYFNYNTEAFGENIFSSGMIDISYSDGYLLGQQAGFPIYNSMVLNDNTNSRLSFSWQQALGAFCIPTENVTNIEQKLFHLKIEYLEVDSDMPSGLCFESNPPFDNQCFTACGPVDGVCSFSDCTNSAGEQILDDIFDCAFMVVLPVDVLNFDATVVNDAVKLFWSVENEIDFSHYDLERSLDGQHFNRISKIDSKPGDIINDYEFYDHNILYNTVYYYRLKQIDLNGWFEYSDIKSIRLLHKEIVNVYPNPTKDKLFLSNHANQFDEIKVLDLHGRVVISESLNEESIDVSELNSGFYMLHLISHGQVTFTERVVVSK